MEVRSKMDTTVSGTCRSACGSVAADGAWAGSKISSVC